MKLLAINLLLGALTLQQASVPQRLVIDRIDAALQEKFTRKDNGQGVSRIAPMVGPHGQLFIARNSPLIQTSPTEPAVAVAFYHIQPPLKPTPDWAKHYYSQVRYIGGEASLLELSSLQLDRADLSSALTPVAEKHKKTLLQGKPVEFARNDKWVAFRPILARKACLECHKTAKEGEGLGALVYVAKKTAP